jgi:hypothetical protein
MMARPSEIHITADMLRRYSLANVAARWAGDLCALVATGLLSAGMASWALAACIAAGG